MSHLKGALFIRNEVALAVTVILYTWVLPLGLHAGEGDTKPPQPGANPVNGPDRTALTPQPQAGDPILNLSLEELFNVRVTSTAKREERIYQSDSAVYVITSEDIRRSGATHVAEALRMAPGVFVGKSNANKFGVTIRGFGGVFSNKLLVLVDGRSVYNPLFSGVYWDAQDLMLENIERIEVIRGPGATLWGANAVNGVINIISKPAADTQGTLVSALAGTETRAIGAVRHGGTNVDKSVSYRVYARFGDRDDSSTLNTDRDAKDEWKNARGGFRVDWLMSKEDKVTFQGDYYEGNYEQRSRTPVLTPPFTETRVEDAHYSGGNLLGRWSHQFSDTSNMNLQVYYDNTVRDEAFLRQEHNTGDIDFDHNLQLGRHNLVYGLEYRVVAEDLRNSFAVVFDPAHDVRHLISIFAQDEITILRDKLNLTVGSKFEHNDFTGFEVQPNLRLLWTPHKHHAVWASVSRAVRTPAPTETALEFSASVTPGADGVLRRLALISNDEIDSETLIAAELGYRAQLHKRFALDAAGFYNMYDHLRTVEPLASRAVSQPSSHVLMPIRFETNAYGETFGGELAATWKATDRWNLSAHYSYLKMQLHTERGSADPLAESGERSNPQNIAHVRSFLSLPHNVEFDTGLYYVDNNSQDNISRYVRVDARIGWRPLQKLELSLAGQNLFDDRHQEVRPSTYESATEVERNFYFKLVWKF